MPSTSIPTERSVYAWAFYDWANSAFATTVMAGFFPLFFKTYWNAGVAGAMAATTVSKAVTGSPPSPGERAV